MDTPDASLARETLDALLERISQRTPGPGAGSAAGITCSLAASLVQMAARFDASVPARTREARAAELRERALELAEREVTAYRPVLDALALPVEDPERETRVATARAQAATAPLAIASIGAQLTALAADSAVNGPDQMVGEAVVAAELADGACRAAAHLVRIDLRQVPDDPRWTEVTGLVSAASEALEEALRRAAELAGAAPS